MKPTIAELAEALRAMVEMAGDYKLGHMPEVEQAKVLLRKLHNQ